MASLGAFADLVPDAAEAADRLLPVVTGLETGGNRDPNNAVSKTGALGRNQIQPTTAQQYGADPARLNDPAYNDQTARTILADLASRYPGDDGAVLAGYNGGPGRAAAYVKAGDDPSVLPTETQGYLTKSGLVKTAAPAAPVDPALAALGIPEVQQLQPEPDEAGSFSDLVPDSSAPPAGAGSFADLVPPARGGGALANANVAETADAAYAAAHKGQPAPDMSMPAGKPDPAQQDPGRAAGWSPEQLEYADTHGITLSLAPPDGWATTLLKTAQNIPAALKQGGGEALSGISEALQALGTRDGAAPLPGLTEHAKLGKDIAQRASADIDANAPRVPAGSAKKFVSEGLTGAATMAPMIVASAVTKSDAPLLSVFAAQGYGQGYDTAIKRGRTEEQAQQDGAFNAAATALPAELPLHAILKPGQKLVGKVASSALGAGVAMGLTTALQKAYDAGVVKVKMTWGEALNAIKDSSLNGLFVGALLGGAGHVAGAGKAEQVAEAPPAGKVAPPTAAPAAPAARIEPTFTPKPTVPDEVANPPVPIPPRADLTPVHDPKTWAQTGWQDAQGNVLPLDAPAVEPAPAPAAVAPAADQTAAIIADQPSPEGEALAREFPKVPPKAAAESPESAEVPPGNSEKPIENADKRIEIDMAKAALASNIDPVTGQRPKGNAALRDFRARMQAVVDAKPAAGEGEVSHETKVPIQEPSSSIQEPSQAFDPNKHIDAAMALIKDRSQPLTVPALAKKLNLQPDQAARVTSMLASRPDSGVTLGQNGTLRRKPVSTGPEHVAQAVAAMGGIRDDQGHSLVKGRGLQQFVPGHGPMIRPTGKSLDQVGQHLWEAGYFGQPEKMQNGPSEAETLDLLEKTAGKTKVFKPEDAATVDETKAGARATEENDRARQDVIDAAKDLGEHFGPDDIESSIAMMGERGISAEDAVHEHVERLAMRQADDSVKETGDDKFGDIPFDTEAEAAPSGENGRLAGERGEPSEDHTGDRVEKPAGRGDAAEAAAEEDSGRSAEQPAAAGHDAALKTEAGADGLDQTIVPGGEKSAQQLAAAREAEGHGRSRAKAPQKDAGGLFEPKTEQTEDMFAAKPAKPERAASKKPEPEILQDAGEKIGGARKDRWAERGMRVSDLEGLSEGEAFQHVTKDAVWPKPDFAKMVEAGTDPHVAAQVKIIRDRLAARPRVDSAQGRRDYVEMMGHVRAELEGVKTAADLKNARDKIIYDRLGWDRDKGAWREQQAGLRDKLFSIFNGRHETLAPAYADAGKAKKMIDAGFPGDIAPWTRRFDVRQSGDGFFITQKGKFRTLEKGFATKEEAGKRAAELYEESKGDDGKLPPPTRPALDKIEREGPDVRHNRDVDGDDFVKDFGFRGVEFGNWVAGDERQKSVNLAYDGLHDLAETLGIPPSALSLDGKLGLAFGARGSGKAAAHYEPGKLVINLTKTSGAGSLAHEWGHALDHHFGVLDKPKGTKGETEGASGWYHATRDRMPHLKNLRPEMAEAFDKLMSAMFRRDKERAEAVRDAELRLETLQATKEKYQAQLDRHLAQPEKDQQKSFVKQSREYLEHISRQAKAMGDHLAALRDESKPYTPSKTESSYFKSAKALSGKAAEKGYWARPTELLARSFESYVFDRLKQQGRKSQYLVQGVEPTRYAEGYAGNPYPAGKERDAINAAYDHLFKEMKTREGDNGPVLFSKRTEEKPFYSSLTRTIEEMRQEKASPEQWAAIIDNAKSKGVKQEEIDWSGVKDWLGEQKGAVTKADLLAHLRENEVHLKEVRRGTTRENMAPDQQAQDEHGPEFERLNEAIRSAEEIKTKTRHDPRYGRQYEEATANAYRLRGQRERLHDRMVDETMARSGLSGEPSKFSQYKLPGGENYRELLMTMSRPKPEVKQYDIKQEGDHFRVYPKDSDSWVSQHPSEAQARKAIEGDQNREIALDSSKKDYKSGHWDEPNILAHVRFDDRAGPNGEKILHMAEVQSDWHQQGRRKGYNTGEGTKAFEAANAAVKELRPKVQDMVDRHDLFGFDTAGEARAAIAKEPDNWEYDTPEDKALAQEWSEKLKKSRALATAKEEGVPDAPFKSTWHELALKRMLRYAAENGYDKLTWDRGETQAARYDLSKQLSRVDWIPNASDFEKDHEGTLEAFDKDRAKVFSKGIKASQISDHVGKDVADKLLTGENLERMKAGLDAKVEGLDLRVGGEGMKGFYDKIVPNFLNKYGKKWGAKVGETSLPGPTPKGYITERNTTTMDGQRKSYVVYADGGHELGEYKTHAEAQERLSQGIGKIPVHSIDITPAMKEGVMGGQPMFQKPFGKRAPGEISKVSADMRFTDAFKAQREEIGAALRDRLDKMGLDDVALKVPDWIKAKEEGQPDFNVDGVYSPLRKLIGVSIETQHGHEHTLDHESIHAMRDLGVFTGSEWKILENKAKGWVDKYNIRKNYEGSTEEKMLEEGVAHAYPDWVRGKLGNAGNAVARIFRKISNVLEATRNALNGLGFKSADDIFEGVQSGEIGRRGGDGTLAAGNEPSFAKRNKPEPEDENKPKPGFLRGLTKPLDELLGPKAEKWGEQINKAAASIVPDSVIGAKDGVKMALAPMSTGTPETRAAAKDFANGMRMARMIAGRQQDYLKSNFKPDQLERMWTAADEQSVLMQQGKEIGPDQGLNRLTPEERATVEAFQADSRSAAKEAMAVGILKGELPSYVPRMGVAIAADGAIGRLGYGGEHASGLDAIGRNLRTNTPNAKQRKHLTADETEAAMKGISADAVLVKDIRTVPLAAARLREATAGRTLINAIREIGKNAGEITVSEGADPTGTTNTGHKFFTIDHPAFKTYRPKLFQDEETGKWRPLEDEGGNPIMEKVPLYVRDDFEGPLRAVLSKAPGPIYKAFMDIKGKTMSVIMYSPAMHNAVIWGKAFPAAPLKLLTPWYRGADGKLRPGLQLYGEGRVAKNDPVVMKEAVNNGLDPIGHRYFNQDITGMMEMDNIKPGRSWTSQVIGAIPNLYSREAGDAVKRAIDKAGDVWHNKFLWDLVGDLQMGLYTHMRDNAIKDGHDPQTAGRMAAHFANRYGGALPIESMSRAARMTSNFLMFSRSFTLTNVGAFKDLVRGLPQDVQAQILRDKGVEALNSIQGTARRKAATLLAMDVALSYAGVYLAQHALAYLMGRNATSPSDNEPDKERRFLIGYQKDGTGIYGRLPTGKVGEDLQDWVTEPADIGNRKLSPYGRLIYGLTANDAGFGKKIYDKHDRGMGGYLRNIGRISEYAAETILPLSAADGLTALAEHKGETKTNLMKILLPMAGITVSKGAPGGPALGQLYDTKEENEFRVGEKMDDIRTKIGNGDIQGASKEMTELGIDRSRQRYIIRSIKNPGSRLTKSQMQQFMRTSSPDEQAKMKALQQQQQENRAKNQHSALEPGDLKGAISDGSLEKFASSGQTWTRQQAIKAASAAGMPATTAILREAQDPLSPNLQKLAGSYGVV